MKTLTAHASAPLSAPAPTQPNLSAGLLRVFTCGSVDDGKSTLIGRLLHDSKSLHEDQIEAVARASARRHASGGGNAPNALDLSLLTDGLRAEREQGITIDVAYRFFATPRRRFILADTPGHVQYTRNMATGASTADVAIILIDARHGVVEQTRRHACLAALLGVPRLIVCVNKMDMVAFDQARFEDACSAFRSFAAAAKPSGDEPISERAAIDFIPISAPLGDNVVDASPNMPWYRALALLPLLESLPIQSAAQIAPRLPIQFVLRPQTQQHHDYRGYAGRLASGSLHVGDEVTVLPGGHRSRIAAINVGAKPVEFANAGQSIAVQLTDDIDASRGDMIVLAHSSEPDAPIVTQSITATLVWMDAQPLAVGRRFVLKHTTRQVTAVVKSITHRLNIQTLAIEHGTRQLTLNETGRVDLRLGTPIVCEPYAHSRETGSFILIDERSNNTVAAGLIGPVAQPEPDAA